MSPDSHGVQGVAGSNPAVPTRPRQSAGASSFRQVFAASFLPEGSLDLVHAFDELQRVSATAADAVRFLKVADQIDVRQLAPRVSCPTLVLHARNDHRVPFEEGRLFATLIPGARFVPLEGRNHILLAGERAWTEFGEELRAFLPSKARASAAFAALTARELALLDFLARGLDNHQIAAHLALSEKTVRNMVSSILAKMEVESRSQAIVHAREAGFGEGTAAT